MCNIKYLFLFAFILVVVLRNYLIHVVRYCKVLSVRLWLFLLKLFVMCKVKVRVS